MTLDLDVILPETLKSFVTKEEIEALEGELLQTPNQPDVPVNRFHFNGIYVKEILLPEGGFAIGHEHTGDFVNIVVSGRCSVLVDGEVRIIEGPSTFMSKGHDRKIGYIHKDTRWITIHRTDKDTVEEIDNSIIIKSETFKRWEESQKLTA